MRGFSLGMLALFVFCGLGVAHGVARADTTCPDGGCKTYLSMITYTAQIALRSPADGENTISLAPVLSWKAPFVGIFHIQVSEDSAFLSTSAFPISTTKELQLPLPTQVDTIISTNLKPKTIYYWRVQKTTSAGETFATVSHFTTPPADISLLPPGVQLLAPATNTTLPSPTALLQWQVVPNALYYRIRVFDATEHLVNTAQVAGTVNTLAVSGLVPGATYHWRVKALNAYGWGGFTPDFFFTTP